MIDMEEKTVLSIVNNISKLSGMYNHQIAHRIGITMRVLRFYLTNQRDIDEITYRKLVALERESRENVFKYQNQTGEISQDTKSYIDKQLTMQSYVMGRIFLNHLSERPYTVAELSSIVGIKRQSASRKAYEMEAAGVVSCRRNRNRSTIVSLVPGAVSYVRRLGSAGPLPKRNELQASMATA